MSLAVTPPVAGSPPQGAAGRPTAAARDTAPAPAAAWPAADRMVAQRIAVVVAAVGLPLLRPGGPGNTGPVDVGLLLGLVATAAWASWSRHKLRIPYVIPVGLLIAGGAVAAVVHEVGALGAALTLDQDAYVLLWGVALANLVARTALLRTALRAIGVSGVGWAAVMIVGVVGHVPALSGVTAREGSRASLTLGDPNLAANYFLVALFVLRASRYPRRAVVRWPCCLVVLAAMFLTGSNGGALTLLLATAVGVVLRLARTRGGGPAIALALILGAGAVAALSLVDLGGVALRAQTSLPALRDSIGRQAESSSSRDALTAEGAQLWRDDGMVGVGPGRTKAELVRNQAPYVKEAHDDYLAAFVERGAIGGIGVLLLLGDLLVRAQRIALRPVADDVTPILPRPELLAAAVVAVLVSASLYEVLHFRHVWALFGIVAGVEIWGRR
ncbi:MAG TPA: O-antigen ligase family protein [Kineosporiaceae bacterium]